MGWVGISDYLRPVHSKGPHFIPPLPGCARIRYGGALARFWSTYPKTPLMAAEGIRLGNSILAPTHKRWGKIRWGGKGPQGIKDSSRWGPRGGWAGWGKVYNHKGPLSKIIRPSPTSPGGPHSLPTYYSRGGSVKGPHFLSSAMSPKFPDSY